MRSVATIRCIPRTRWRQFLKVCAAAVLPILTPGIIVGGIVGGLFTPTEASVVAVLYAMLAGCRHLPHARIQRAQANLYDSARFAGIALFCIGTASAFGWLLAYFHIPQLVVNAVASWGGGITSVGFITAAAFLFIGCFIDAIPAIIIVGTILAPLAAKVGMHPIHFAIIGVISIAYGLVTPPYGLCLMIACSIGGIKIKEAVRDTAILFIPMLLGAADRDPVSGPDPVAAAQADARVREIVCNFGSCRRFRRIRARHVQVHAALRRLRAGNLGTSISRSRCRTPHSPSSRPRSFAVRCWCCARRSCRRSSSSRSRAGSGRPSRT